MQEVLGGVACHADEGVARVVALVLAKPVECVAVLQDATAVGVDVLSLVIRPDLAGADSNLRG